jgi:alkanesulfonate monooxygenase SsuD/methylene tetrahydromethanopterin reductase-like flavin-dependent oxidoreductase (luciferase family)
MQFGLFYEWPNPTLRPWKTLFEEGVEQIQYSEEQGFDYCLIAEHHFTTYGNSPPLSCKPCTSDSGPGA